jgi:hypothetical protein
MVREVMYPIPFIIERVWSITQAVTQQSHLTHCGTSSAPRLGARGDHDRCNCRVVDRERDLITLYATRCRATLGVLVQLFVEAEKSIVIAAPFIQPDVLETGVFRAATRREFMSATALFLYFDGLGRKRDCRRRSCGHRTVDFPDVFQ